jgi:signal transduction histidine kinase
MFLPRRPIFLVLLAGAPIAPAGWAAEPAVPPDFAAGYAVLDRLAPSGAYGTGPVFSLAQDRDGLLFVGSTKLSVFDGNDWQFIEVPGATRLLTITVESAGAAAGAPERIWVGGDGPLGYVTKTATGYWHFIALPVQPDSGPAMDIRAIEPDAGGGAVFVARSRILRWDGARFRSWDLPNSSRLYTFVYRDRLHVYQPGTGVHVVERTGPRLILADRDLPVHDPVVGLVDCPDGGQLAVFSEAVFKHLGREWIPIKALSDTLRGRRAMATTLVEPHQMAIGTAYGGVVLCSANGSLAAIVNSQNGLTDDNVDSVLGDASGQVWIGTSTGLVRWLGAGQASIFDERTRLTTGVIRRVLELNGSPRVVTSRRIYELEVATSTEPARLNRIDAIWPQLREAAVQRGQIWLGGTGGLWRIEGRGVVQEPAVSGDVSSLLIPAGRPDRLVFFERNAARALVGEEGRRRLLDLGQTFDGAPNSAVEDGAGRIWVATASGHIRIFTWNDRGDGLRLAGQLEPGRGLPAGARHIALTAVRGVIYAFCDGAIMRSIDPVAGFVSVPELAGFLGQAAVSASDGQTFWCVQGRPANRSEPNALIELHGAPEGAPVRWSLLQVPGLGQLGDVHSLSLTGAPGHRVLWIGGENSLLRLQTASLKPAQPVPQLKLRQVQVDGSGRAALADAGQSAVFPPSTKRLEFAFAAGVSETHYLYQTRLQGIERDWAPPRPEPHREFTGLPAGNYVFSARAMDRAGRTGLPLSYGFVVEAAWYRRTWAMALWLAVAALLAWAGLKWRVRRLKSQAARLERLVNDRTRELSLSNTARGEFLDTLSHEIRRPLDGVVSLTRRLEASELTPEQREQARLLRLGGESLLNIFQEALEYSAMECGALEALERPFQVRELLNSVLEECCADGSRPAVRYSAVFTDGFVGDDSKLKTIVSNFMVNAQRHAPGAVLEIAVSCTETAVGVADVLIDVTDGGPGVPAEEHGVIFKRFVRGSRAKAERVPGTGLGLATCRALARVIGGSIGVESPSERAHELGCDAPGATFFVRASLRRSSPFAGVTTAGAGVSG